LYAFSDVEFVCFLQEKERRFIGENYSERVVNISEKNQHQVQVCSSLLIASYVLFVYLQLAVSSIVSVSV